MHCTPVHYTQDVEGADCSRRLRAVRASVDPLKQGRKRRYPDRIGKNGRVQPGRARHNEGSWAFVRLFIELDETSLRDKEFSNRRNGAGPMRSLATRPPPAACLSSAQGLRGGDLEDGAERRHRVAANPYVEGRGVDYPRALQWMPVLQFIGTEPELDRARLPRLKRDAP